MADDWEELSLRITEIVLAGKQQLAAGSPVASLELDAYALWWRDLSNVVDVYQAGCAALTDQLPGFRCATGPGESIRWADPDEPRRAVACTHAAALCTSLADFLSVFASDTLNESPEALARVRARYAPDEPAEVALERVDAALNPDDAADAVSWLEALELVFSCGLPPVVVKALTDLLDHREQLAHLSSRTACPAPSYARMHAWALAAHAMGTLFVLSLTTRRERRLHSVSAHPRRDIV